MKVFKIFRYHAVFLLYYLICFSLIVMSYYPPSAMFGGLAPFFIIAALISPFFVTGIIINKLYYKDSKNKHATNWAVTITILTFLYLLGVSQPPSKLSNEDILLILFNACMVISLFVFAYKNSTKTIKRKANSNEKLKDLEISKQDNYGLFSEVSTKEASRHEQGNNLDRLGSDVKTNAKTIADKIRELKSHKNNLNGGLQGVATAIYDGALETAATVIENGGKLIDAIKAAIIYIKENSDEKDDDKIYITIIKDLTDAGIIENISKSEDKHDNSNPLFSREPSTKMAPSITAKERNNFKLPQFNIKLSKKSWIIFCAIFLLFFITNPSLEDFRSYLHLGSARYYEGTGRDVNCLIGSIYSQNNDGNKKKYLGVLKNFFDITPKPNYRLKTDSSDSDTLKKIDTTLAKPDTASAYQKSLRLKKALTCTPESAKADFLAYMKFNYPDYKIYGNPVVNEQDDCVYEIQFTTRKKEDYSLKEVVIAQISFDYDYSHYYFKTIRGVLY